MKIYIVYGCRIDGVEYAHWNIKAFKSKYDATMYQDRLKVVYDKLAVFYAERYKLCRLNNDDWHFSDYERSQKYEDVEFDLQELELL